MTMTEDQFHVGRLYNFTANLAFERENRAHSLRLGMVTAQGEFIEFTVFASRKKQAGALMDEPMGVKIEDTIHVMDDLGPIIQAYLKGRFPGGTIFEAEAREAALAEEFLSVVFPAADRFMAMMTGLRGTPDNPWIRQDLRDRFDELIRATPARVEAKVAQDRVAAGGRE